MITRGSELVGLELVAYRSPTPDNERYERDEAFQRTYHDGWLFDSTVSEFSVRVVYERDSSGRAIVPKPADHPDTIEELKQLVKSFCSGSVGDDQELRFRPAEAREEIRIVQIAQRAVHFFSADRFPQLARHFSEVSVTHHRGIRLGTLRTDLSSAFVGIDPSVVERILRKKLDAARSREGSRHAFWILVHFDGWPLSACVGSEENTNLALEVASKVSVEGARDSGVDQIWWMENTWIESSRRARRIWSAS